MGYVYFYVEEQTLLLKASNVIMYASLALVSVLLCAPDHRWQRAGIIVSSNLAGLRFHPSIEYLSDADFICDDEGSGEELRDEQPDRTVLP